MECHITYNSSDVVLAVKAWSTLNDIEAEELLSMHFEDVFNTKEATIIKAINYGKNLTLVIISSFWKKPKECSLSEDGSLIWVNIESSLVKLGKKSFIIVMGHDISEKKSVEMKLQELDELRRQFIDRASHELKTPITTIYGAFQLLDKFHKHKFDDESSDIFEMALSGTKRLKKLVESLLDLSRLESKMFKLEKSSIDLTNLIRKCVNEVKYLMKSRNQTYDLTLPNSLNIDVDDSRIELVLTNLLTNAIKYTPTSGKITIRLDNIGNSVQILVKDTGIGLTKDELNKLFKKFSKIKTPIQGKLDVPLESTGLGLHIAKEIVLLHGGEIWAESEGRNKGSTFFITLPIK